MSADLTAKDVVKGAAAAACNPWELAVIIPEDHPDYKLLEEFHQRQMLLMRDFWANHFSKLSDKRILKIYRELPEFVRTTIGIYANESDEEKAYEHEQKAWAAYQARMYPQAAVPQQLAGELPPQLGDIVGVVAGTEYVGELTVDKERFAKK